jgi:hypothetical protein
MFSDLIEARSGVRLQLRRLQSSCFLPKNNGWAVMLAGGDGTRLHSLTLKIAAGRFPLPIRAGLP